MKVPPRVYIGGRGFALTRGLVDLVDVMDDVDVVDEVDVVDGLGTWWTDVDVVDGAKRIRILNQHNATANKDAEPGRRPACQANDRRNQPSWRVMALVISCYGVMPRGLRAI